MKFKGLAFKNCRNYRVLPAGLLDSSRTDVAARLLKSITRIRQFQEIETIQSLKGDFESGLGHQKSCFPKEIRACGSLIDPSPQSKYSRSIQPAHFIGLISPVRRVLPILTGLDALRTRRGFQLRYCLGARLPVVGLLRRPDFGRTGQNHKKRISADTATASMTAGTATIKDDATMKATITNGQAPLFSQYKNLPQNSLRRQGRSTDSRTFSAGVCEGLRGYFFELPRVFLYETRQNHCQLERKRLIRHSSA